MADFSSNLPVGLTGLNLSSAPTYPVNADSNGNMNVRDYADGATGSAVPSVTTQVGGSDGTNLRTLATDTSGRLKVDLFDASGNALNSTSNALNAFLTNSTLAVTQSTSPWVVKDQADGPVSPGTVASFSMLMGGQYNSSLPTLTNTQQAALQTDSSGRLLVNIANASVAVTQSTSPWVVAGNLTNNNAAPAATNVGALVALAESTLSASRYTTGEQVLLVTDLAGNTNVDLQYYLGAAVSKTNPIATTISDGTNVITAAISAYGTAPTGTEVMGVNAYITNTPTVNQGTSPWVVQDNASNTSAATAVARGLQTMGVFNTTPATLTNGQAGFLQLDSAENLLVNLKTALPTGANTIGAVTQASGPWTTTDAADGSVTGGTAGTKSMLMGGIYNTSLPTLTNGQQAGIQLDSSARQIISPLTTASVIKVDLQDGSGNAITSSNNGLANQQLLNTQTPNTTVASVALGALNATVSIPMAGLASCGFQMAAGTFIGTITPQCSIDGGTTWVNIAFLEPAIETVVTSYTFTTANTATILTLLPVGGSTNCRVIVTAYTSGTANCIMTASEISISTGSTASVATDLSGSGNITAVNQTVVAVLHGCAAMVWDVQGTFVATIQFQATVNGGTDWFNIQGIYAPYNTVSGIWSAVTQVIISCGGYQQVRALCTSYTSGTMNLYWDASAGSNFTWSYVYNQTATNLQTLVNAYETSGSYPDPYNVTSYTPAPMNQDAFGNLQIRGPALSDEGSVRDDFTGTSLTTTLSGTSSFTNGSDVVNGTGGTAYNTQVGVGQYIKINTDSETDYAQVSAVLNSSSLTLETNYNGSTNTGATAVISNWKTTTGSGSLTVASSLLSIASGTVNGNTTSIVRDIDYLPLSMTAYASISQRISNQTAIIGFVDDSGNNAAVVQFTGTTNTTVNFITAFSSQATDIQTTAVTLPNSAVTSSVNEYVIDLSASQATLSINGIIVAVNTTHLPGPYEDLQASASITNSATVTTTTLAIDSIYIENIDRLQVTNDFSGEPFPVFGNLNSGQADNNSAPVKIGAVYNSAQPTYSTGQRSDLQSDANGNLRVTQLAITKGTQGATGLTVQDLKDAGRNQTNYFMAAQVISTAAEALQSLTGYKSGAAVAATTTPAVVTAAKTYRIQKIVITYVAITTAGVIQVNLRANTGGTVVVTSPLVDSWSVGGPSTTAGVSQTVTIPIPDGMEFAAGTGIGITVQGFGATGAAAAVGYAKISVSGYEY